MIMMCFILDYKRVITFYVCYLERERERVVWRIEI